jgi:hypothetical protein
MRGMNALLIATLVVLVCAQSSIAADEELSSIEGKVTYKGVALKEGVITLYLKDDQFVGAKLQPDGTFRVDRVPVGTVKVTFSSKKFRLPAKYGIPETSPLTLGSRRAKASRISRSRIEGGGRSRHRERPLTEVGVFAAFFTSPPQAGER